METNQSELAYWMIRNVARAMAGDALVRRTLTSGRALQAMVDGLEEARENVEEARKRANAGH